MRATENLVENAPTCSKEGENTMARKEMITIDGETKPGLNVSNTVGPPEQGGLNHPGDVMLIQAMLLFSADFSRMSRFKLPVPSGKFDHETVAAIVTFQDTIRGSLVAPVDGVIHPASYK